MRHPLNGKQVQVTYHDQGRPLQVITGELVNAGKKTLWIHNDPDRSTFIPLVDVRNIEEIGA